MKPTDNTKSLDLQQGAFKYFGTAKSDRSGSHGWAPRYKNVTQEKCCQTPGELPRFIIWIFCEWGKIYYVNQRL